MNRQEIKYRVKCRRRKEEAKRRMILLLAAVMLITIGSVLFGSVFISAGSDVEAHDSTCTYYKSIQIEEGDSLWSIAKKYRTKDYSSTEEYIECLREMNGLSSDTIHAGQNLIVAYSVTAN